MSLIEKIWTAFSRKEDRDIQPVDREFHIPYFKDESIQDKIAKTGYVLLRDGVTRDQIDALQGIYQKLTSFEGYDVNELFVNSGRFASPEIRKFVMDAIGGISRDILPSLFNPEAFDPETTGAFQIKPPSKKSALNPHQDSPVIDETRDHALFVWIPLCDITLDNGPVYVLPGSHLWCNYQRSLNVKWAFEKHASTLWKYMHPIEMKAGDVLCWDSALIHGSSPNKTNETRVAITTTLLPRNFKMVEYFQDKQEPSIIEKYRVERSFWESGNIMDRPPCPPNELLDKESEAFPSDITRNEIKNLVQRTWKKINFDHV